MSYPAIADKAVAFVAGRTVETESSTVSVSPKNRSLGALTMVSVDTSAFLGVDPPLLPVMGLKSGSTAKLHCSPRRVHLTFLLRSAFNASLSISHFRNFSARSAFLAFSYANRLSCTVCTSETNGELAVLVEGVITSISPVLGLMPCTPR